MMNVKTTQEIIEKLGISVTKHNRDKVRDFTTEWVLFSEAEKEMAKLQDKVNEMGEKYIKVTIKLNDEIRKRIKKQG